MDKATRKKVYDKYNGLCAYCGKAIEYKDMQVDHIVPAWHNYKDKDDEWWKTRSKLKRGTDDIENLNPACRRCNGWKSTFDIEQFREEIELQTARLKRDSSSFRMALDYGQLTIHQPKVKFYFETTITNLLTE